MGNASLFRLAAASAWLAIPALLLAGLFLALFFGGRGEPYGPLNDIFTALSLLLLILPAIAVYLSSQAAAGSWLTVVTWLAVAGMVIGAAGQVLLVIGVINLQTSFVTGSIGILPVLAWAISIAVLSLGLRQLSASLGWLMVAVLLLALFLTLASSLHWKLATWLFAGGLITALVAWLGSLGRDLIRLA
ncbi:MAG: hypothetical protein EXR60_01220 [Dehalococcoidia bacterium]|nr:hypothetical protein [Dehalococcoidia bacterium]